MTQRQLDAFVRFAEKYTREVTKTREDAVAALKREGVYTADGKLAPEFSTAEQPIAAFLAR